MKLERGDSSKLLVFMDILGFGAVTHRDKRRLRHRSDGVMSSTGTTDMSDLANRFTGIVEGTLQNERLYNSNIQGMLFSDCAYVALGSPTKTALVAGQMMRNLLSAGVPVRMGIGRGTFYQEQFSTLIVGKTMIAKSIFFGTAVVRAFEAEHCGGKGMRIFVHPSAVPAFDGAFGARLIPLPQPLNEVEVELDYLTDTQERDCDKEEVLFKLTAARYPTRDPLTVRRQYIDTFRALNRMRKAHGRAEIRYQQLPGYREPMQRLE